MSPDQIKSFISEQLDCSHLSVEGDGVHFEAVAVSDKFLGISKISWHKMIYEILGDKMKAEIHALSIKTFIPEQWNSKKL